MKILTLPIFVTLFCCINCSDRTRNINSATYTPFVNTQLDSMIMEEFNLDTINGVVYIFNPRCSKCVVDFSKFIKECASSTFNKKLYVASNDTLLVNYFVGEILDSLSFKRFIQLELHNKQLPIIYSGYIINKSKDSIYYKKYQSGIVL